MEATKISFSRWMDISTNSGIAIQWDSILCFGFVFIIWQSFSWEIHRISSSSFYIFLQTNGKAAWRLHAQLTLSNPVDCSPPGSSVHGFSQARILEWVAFYFSRGSSWPRGRTCVSRVSCIDRRFFTMEPPGKPSLEVSYFSNQFADVVVRPLEGERMSLKLCSQWTRSLGSRDQDSHHYPFLCFPEGGCTLAFHYSECGPWTASPVLLERQNLKPQLRPIELRIRIWY